MPTRKQMRAELPPSETTEVWIGPVERCGAAWTFAILSDSDEPECRTYCSRTAAERARSGMFRLPGRAISVAAADIARVKR